MVPMTVDCLLVGNPDQQSVWAITNMNYSRLALGLLPDAPPPLTRNPTPPNPGAHLMWTLPYALRSGKQIQSGASAGNVQFPSVPNRWMVLRLAYGAPGTAPVLTAGVVQSDLLTAINSNTISQYPDPDDPANSTLQIGGYVPIATWTSPAAPATPFLQAVGPGDVSWAAAYDNVRNVFSFYDALPAPASGSTTYTYSVIGWYADPVSDPMYVSPTDTAQNWLTTVANAFQWSVGELSEVQQAQAAWAAWQTAHGLSGGAANLPAQLLAAIQAWVNWQTANGISVTPASLPQQTICHGMVTNVVWSGSGTAYGTGAPNQGGTVFPNVALGNTATEAIAAWMADYVVTQNHGDPNTIPFIETAVEAFQKGYLFELAKDPTYVETRLHRARFNATSAGQYFAVVRPQSDPSDPPDYSGDQSIPLDADQTNLLTTLNGLQAQLNEAQLQLQSQQLELFAVQYKVLNPLSDEPQPIVTAVNNALAVLQAQVGTQRSAIATLQQQVNTANTALTTALAGKYEIRFLDLPSSYSPNDPVVMLSAVGADAKFAAPGTYTDGDTLFTRFTGQTLTGIEVDYTGNGLPSSPQLIAASDLLNLITIPLGAGMPKEIPDLWIEALLLDSANAALLATIYFEKRGIAPPGGAIAALTATIQQQQAAPFNDGVSLGVTPVALANGLGLQGVPPAAIAVEYRTGQPWSPIYLDWQVQWFPTGADPSGQFTGWKLGDIDYEWTGTSIPQANVSTYSGRSVLNLKIAQDLAAKIETFTSTPSFKGLPLHTQEAVTEIAEVIGQFDIVTQSLGGFTQQLGTRIIAPGQQPGAELQGNTPNTFRPVAGTATTDTPFYPVRSGHFMLIDVWIVDSWGQIWRGKNPNLPNITPLIATSMTTPGTNLSAFAQLPPRISQPAAAVLQLLDAGDDTIPSNSSDLTSPICGWVMSNLLDQSLMVFDAAGNNQGAVLLVGTDVSADSPTGQGVRWDAAPGLSSPLGAAPDLPNTHLEAMTQGLLQVGLTSGGQALIDLMNSLDSSFWAMDPGPAAGNLSVVVGRPTAVVRAQLSFDLAGYPIYNQSWSQTGQYYVSGNPPAYKPTPPPFLSVTFGFRIGDLGDSGNGVLGYFLNDDYTTFYAVYGAGNQTADMAANLRMGVRGKNLAQLSTDNLRSPASGDYVQFNHLVQLPPDSSTVRLTILLDPRGYIPVVSGSLPVVTAALDPGPVTAALANMEVNFRMGPLLEDPGKVQMPLPSEIHGKWSWVARKDITSWDTPADIGNQDAVARIGSQPPRLREGWLTLTGGIKS